MLYFKELFARGDNVRVEDAEADESSSARIIDGIYYLNKGMDIYDAKKAIHQGFVKPVILKELSSNHMRRKKMYYLRGLEKLKNLIVIL